MRTYTELSKLKTFEERLKYLYLGGEIGKETFGVDRYFNQLFYRSKEWEAAKRYIITRDNGCDLGVKGLEIFGRVLVHHMNPISIDDINESTKYLLNPEYLITVSLDTHNAIHYGRRKENTIIERSQFDTCPWLLKNR